MKTNLYFSIIMLGVITCINDTNAQTNKTLSNLTAPTAINQTLLPDSNNSKDLGSSALGWKNAYIIRGVYLNKKLIMHAPGAGNFFMGSDAGKTSSTGSFNTGAGQFALGSLTSGFNNTASGYSTLYNNTSGRDNTVSGYIALYLNTTGSFNTASGSWALYKNSTGNNNTAYGYSALWQNQSGNDNTAIGKYAMYSNTTGYSNVAIGANALFHSARTNNLVAIGDSAMYNFTGDKYTNQGYSTAVGSKALYSVTTGNENTAIGFKALYSTTSGSVNVAVGNGALYNNTEGIFNTAVGRSALSYNSTGQYNTAVGFQSNDINQTGSSNTAIGAYAGPNSFNSISNSTSIGYNTDATASNQIRLGNSAVTSIGGQVGWTIFSDGRYKRGIKENVSGLAFINSLRPITYTVDTKSLDEYYYKKRQQAYKKGKESIDERAKANMDKAADEASRIVYDGFIAQEVEQAAKKLQFEFSGVDKPKTEDGLYGLRYDNFVVPLVKAVQELSAKNDLLQQEVNELKAILQKDGKYTSALSKGANVMLTNTALEQNTPNPFTNTTTIRYSLHQNTTTAQIIITDLSGKIVKQVNVSGAGKGIINVDASSLATGTYNYSLVVNGKIVSTKQMMLTK